MNRHNEMVDLNANKSESLELSVLCPKCSQLYALQVEPDGQISLLRCEACLTVIVIDDPIARASLIHKLRMAGAKEILRRKPTFWEKMFGARNLDIS